MGEKPILTDKKEMIGIITLNRPQEMNTFNVPFARGLNDALRDMDQDDDVRVVVIRASGKHFSTGISLSEFEGKSPKELKAGHCLSQGVCPCKRCRHSFCK